MKKLRKHGKTIILVFVILLCWGTMILVDYSLSKKVHEPIFALNIGANDADIFYGVGYTIIIDDGYAISPLEAELKGYFYWGWR